MTNHQHHHDAFVTVNRFGVQLFQSGDLDGAIATFTDTLSIIRRHHKAGHPRPSTIITSYEDDEVINLMQPHTKHLSEPQRFQSKQELHTSCSSPFDTFGYLYHAPIEVLVDVSKPFQVYGIVAMFNLALTFHMKGRQNRHFFQHGNNIMYHDGDEDLDAALENAVTLYELCYEMMAAERINPGLAFVMALANNLGHAHSMLQNHGRARQCFEHLLSILMYLVDCGEFQQPQQHCSEETWKGYIQNVSNLILIDSCASAA